jgi:putative FmdB family regulatory protein
MEESVPTYSYRCRDCRKRFEVFLTYAEYEQAQVHCTHCNSDAVERRITRVRIAKSEESRLDNIADPSQLAGLENDPRELGRVMRRMSAEMGSEFGDVGPEFEEVVDRLEAGQDPEAIEQALPELGLGADDGGAEIGGDLD